MNLKIVAIAAAGVVGLAACDQGEPRVADRGDAGAAVPQSELPGQEPGRADEPNGLGQTAAVNAVQDAAAGPVGQASAAVSGGATDAFLRNAALGGLYEIRAGQIAQSRSQDPQIRQIAETIVDDHRSLSEDMKMTVAQVRVAFTPPTELDERRQGLIDNLEAASVEDFDEVYLDQQEAAHNEALTLFRAYESRGDVAELRAVAQMAIPVLEVHLEMVQGAQVASNGAAE